MTMQNQPSRPALTPDERIRLQGFEPQLRVARTTLDDLEAIGVDVSADRDLLDRTEQLRSGLLERFSSVQQPLAGKRTRSR